MSICHWSPTFCAVASANGLFVNWTKKLPFAFVARRSSPASSGLFFVGFQSACPSWTRQPADEKSTGTKGWSDRQDTQNTRASKSVASSANRVPEQGASLRALLDLGCTIPMARTERHAPSRGSWSGLEQGSGFNPMAASRNFKLSLCNAGPPAPSPSPVQRRCVERVASAPES